MYTLFKKEIWRFWKVSFQTVAAPVMTALLYLLIFSHALATRLEVYPGVSYTAFLVPGAGDDVVIAEFFCQQFIQPDSVQGDGQHCFFYC